MIYLDNAATTQISDNVRKAMEPYLKDMYGNPSGIYGLARKAKDAIEHSREIIANALGTKPENIFFTSGGTESDNWVLDNATYMGNHIITSNIEHHAILNKCENLEKSGIEVTYVKVDKKGLVHPDTLFHYIEKETSLITIMMANNEIGTIQPIKEIGKIAHRNNVPFHTDAVQAFGHIPISVNDMNIDMLSASAHKFHGPKGVGFLYVRNPKQLMPFIFGGTQEREHRAGTENVAGIVGMGMAAEEAMNHMEMRYQKEKQLRDYTINRILREVPNVRLNGHEKQRLPGNVNITIDGIVGSLLVRLMDKEGICISVGSACSSCSQKPSYVIKALGMDDQKASGTIRISLSSQNTKRELDQTIDLLKKNIRILRNSQHMSLEGKNFS